ncbi:D-allulose-6-phosphate 3-epimerase [Kineothrix alysoides]|uniref:D-allulose-6-phosphate 3-epimerase n=1 Tax=Kineothrix alysoides TaxID=1469948 RepID=A0A4R1R0R0_9FIRM|nr:ribulose-phosphate 3-epimerase [Kineothrix alysoides]TCL58871.1 D-allulose-6-phosphate 3-epimerase [Kineothrix alysoides]
MSYIDKKVFFSPSLMCMDLLEVKGQIEILNTYFDILHIDIMDGHFCDSIHLSPSFVKSVRKVTNLTIEVHLMVEQPEKFINILLDNGADTIILHAESITKRAFRLINDIQSKGRKVGIALCPLTPISSIVPLLRDIDILTLLMVDAGFVGQPLIETMVNKIKIAREIKEKQNSNFIIQCDGGVKNSTYKKLYDAGAESFVLGEAALFGKHNDLIIACETMKNEFIRSMNGV